MAISFLSSQSIDGTLGVTGFATLSSGIASPLLYEANGNVNIVGGGSQINFTRCQIQLVNNGGLTVSVPTGKTLTLSGKVLFDTIANAGIDTDKFLVSSSGVLCFRTGAEVLADIGAGTGNGTVTGTGTAKNLTMWATGGTGIEDSPIKTQTVNTLNQIVVEDAERIIIDKPSSVTSGDPAFQVAQDGTAKTEFGWDDDGGGFAFVYNYSGNGIKLGAAGNNPMIEVVTTTGSESVNLHKQIEFKDYGSGTYTGTAAYNLSVDSSGNVIETSGSSGGTVGGTGTAGTVTQWSAGGADIEDGPITFSGNNSTFAGTGVFEGGGNTLMLKKGTGTPAIAFAGTATDPEASALIEGISGGGLQIYTSNGGTIGTPGWDSQLTIAADGSTTFNEDSEFKEDLEVKGKLSADGGIEGLTLANGGITGANYNISGVNQLTIADPGEGIVFTGTATLTLAVIDDTTDDKLKLTNATQLDLNSTARITNLVDPTGNQDAATKLYVDTKVSGAVRYIGTWSAADNGSTTGGTPDLTDTNLQTPGNYYICEVAGTAEPNGTGTEPDTWAVGDWVIFSDLTTDAWQKIDNSTVLSGAGVANQVARWTDTETLSGGTGFTYAGGATGAIAMGGTLSVDGALTLGTITNATADPDKFLCASSGGTVGYRTGAQVRSDIGAGTGDGSVTSIATANGITGGTITGTGTVQLDGTFTVTNTLDLAFGRSTSDLYLGSKFFNAISGTIASGVWIPIVTVGDSKSFRCTLVTAAHSNVTFIASRGYGPSNVAHLQILDWTYNPNGGYANVSGLRIRQGGQVEMQMTYSSGPIVSVNVKVDGMGASIVSSLAETTSTESIMDTVLYQSLGMMRTRGGLQIENIPALSSAATTFLVPDTATGSSIGDTFTNLVKTRTAAQVLSDIGAASSSSLGSYLPLAGGTMTGNATFDGPQTIFNPDGDSQAKILNVGTNAIALYASSGDGLYLGGGGTTNLYLDTSTGATFSGTIDVGTLTLGGSAIVADVGMTLQVDAGSVNAITIDNVGTVTTSGFLKIPNYLFHDGNTDTYLLFGTDTITLRGDSGISLDGSVDINEGLKVVGPGSYNTFRSGNDYTLGFLDSAGTTQWWIKAYTNGSFALHENGSGDKFTLAAGGTATFSGAVIASSGSFSGSITTGTSSASSITVQDSGTTFLSIFKSSGQSFIQAGPSMSSGETLFIGAPTSGFVQNVNVQGTMDADNFKINGAQGTNGQVMTSTGSGVQWSTPSGGGSGTIGGSGTAGFVPRFSAGTTLGNTNIQNDGTNTTINTDNAIFQITKPGNASNEPTLYVNTSNNRLGFRTTAPGAAFDVNGTIKTLGFNANEQQFFVDPDNKYIKAGAYGQGQFFGITGANNQPKYTYAAGSEGKFVEDERIETIALSGNAFLNLESTGTVILPAPGANSALFIKSITIYKGPGTSGGGWGGLTGFGFCDSGTSTACNMSGGSRSFRPWAYFPMNFVTGVIANSGTWFWQSIRPTSITSMPGYGTDRSTLLNRALLFRSSSNLSTLPNSTWYVQIKYSIINVTAGFTNNVDRTVTAAGSGASGRTAFNAANGTVFNGVCTATSPGNPSANTFYFVNTTNNAGQSYPCNGDTIYTTQTGTTLLPSFYYYLFSGGGERHYIQVVNGIVTSGSGTACDAVVQCTPPI